MPVPATPKLYHIVHVDRLPSIVDCGELWCDALVVQRSAPGTTIGMNAIKRRRLEELELACHPGLRIGQCVPFYFCPRSIMLYLIHCANHAELAYRGGQAPIVHLEFDLAEVHEWAVANNHRWGFTLSNAGSRYFEDRSSLAALTELNWPAIASNKWAGVGVSPDVKDGKQAEFLVELSVPWSLVRRVGIHSPPIAQRVDRALDGTAHRPVVQVMSPWYY